MNTDILIDGLLIGGILSAVGLSIRYFVCLARSERCTPWSSLLGFGWLACLAFLALPAGMRGIPNESDIVAVYRSQFFLLAALLLWCTASIAFAAAETSWRVQRRQQEQAALRPAR